ncbi:MAG: hypothetical protein ABI091_15050, partial [Ferruginibacter sp.]
LCEKNLLTLWFYVSRKDEKGSWFIANGSWFERCNYYSSIYKLEDDYYYEKYLIKRIGHEP